MIIPYFYIIQNKESGLYYAGSKYSKNDSLTTPAKLLTENGYTTSSRIVNEIIEKRGLESFIIRKIRVFDNPSDALKYETRFLKRINARANKSFYNSHNNDGYFDYETKKQLMIQKYGVEHQAQVPEIMNKMKIQCEKTLLERYGVKHNFWIPSVQEKIKKENIEKYGREYFFGTDEWYSKSSKTYLEKYGVNWVTKSVAVKEKTQKTNLEKYGETHHAKTEASKRKLRDATKKQFENPEKREKHRIACIEKNSSRGKIWINKNGKNKKVTQEIFSSEYEKDGWVKGRHFPNDKPAFWDYDKTGENNPYYKSLAKTVREKENK